MADCEAKKAIKGLTSPLKNLPANLKQNRSLLTLPHSITKLKQTHLNKLQTLALKFWKNTKHYKHIYHVAHTIPVKSFRKLADSVPRKHTSLLFQLRSGHTSLCQHLHRIRKAKSPTCPACHAAPRNHLPLSHSMPSNTQTPHSHVQRDRKGRQTHHPPPQSPRRSSPAIPLHSLYRTLCVHLGLIISDLN